MRAVSEQNNHLKVNFKCKLIFCFVQFIDFALLVNNLPVIQTQENIFSCECSICEQNILISKLFKTYIIVILILLKKKRNKIKNHVYVKNEIY